MKKQYINEFAWSKIYNFLKNHKQVYIVEEKKCRKFLDSIFWIARTGAQWRELPEECQKHGKWNSVFSRFNAWAKKKIWEKLLEFCGKDPDLEYIVIDATIVRAHACAAGYGKQEPEGLGRSKGGFTSKIHAKVDALGNLLQVVVTPGQCHETTQAKTLLADVADAHVIADKAYNSYEIRSMLNEQNCQSVIPPRENSVDPWLYDKYIYRERHVIECFFSKLKYFRRIFSRFDKSLRNYTSFIAFVGTCLWLR